MVSLKLGGSFIGAKFAGILNSIFSADFKPSLSIIFSLLIMTFSSATKFIFLPKIILNSLVNPSPSSFTATKLAPSPKL